MGILLHGGTAYLEVRHAVGVDAFGGVQKPDDNVGNDGQLYLQHLNLNGVNIRESITNNATGVYFNTGYKFKENTRFECKFNLSSGATYPTPFGCREDTTGRNTNQAFFSTSGRSVYYAFGNSEVKTDDVFNSNEDVIVFAEKSGLKMYVGTSLKYLSTNAFYQNGTIDLTLFVANLNGQPWTSSWALMTLYYLKIYEGSDLVHYFLPALDNNDVPCLYDAITGTYIYSSGSGGFTVGNALNLGEEVFDSYVKTNGSWVRLNGSDANILINNGGNQI